MNSQKTLIYKRNAASVNSSIYTLGKNSKFVVAKKRRSVGRFAEKGGGRSARVAGAWGGI